MALSDCIVQRCMAETLEEVERLENHTSHRVL